MLSVLALALVAPACVEIDPSYALGATTGDETGIEVDPDEDESGTSGEVVDPPLGFNYAFITSTLHNGNLGGLEGADAICNQRASEAGLPGTFVAYLSDSTHDAIDRLGSASGWVRTDGLVWARDRAALGSDGVVYPLLLTETGESVSLELVFTGTDRWGQRTTDTCGDWRIATNEQAATSGFSTGGAYRWTDVGRGACSNMQPIYCLGVDFDAPVDIPHPPADSRLIFATAATLGASEGRAAADALCSAEAAAAGHRGVFLALMVEPGETLWDRHVLSEGSWVRADGAIVLDTDLGPSGWTQTLAPVVFDAAGQLAGSVTFWAGVGAPTEVATADGTCNGWTDPAYPRQPVAFAYDVDWLYPPTEVSCTDQRSIVCVKQ